MNHPTQERWMSYLYDELPPAEHEVLASHLNACPQCQSAVQQWRGVMQDLDACKLPQRTNPLTVWATIAKWGIAAVVVLGIGIGIGRALAPAPVDVQALRGEIERSVKASLQAELRRQLQAGLQQVSAGSTAEMKQQVDKLDKSIQTARESDRQQIVALLKEMETQRVTDYTSLRKDLETVAVVAEDKLNYAHQQIGRLASYAQVTSSSAAPQK